MISLLSIIIFTITLVLLTFNRQIMIYRNGVSFNSEGNLIPSDLLDFISISTTKITPKTTIANSEILFGALSGYPWKPKLVLSSKLLQNFTPGEVQYVILHELGHYEFKHIVKESALFIGSLIFGVALIVTTEEPVMTIITAILLGLSLSILNIQWAKKSEFEADRYALSNLENPGWMISANRKLLESYQSSLFDRYSLLRFLFVRGIPHSERIKMAQDEQSKREWAKKPL